MTTLVHGNVSGTYASPQTILGRGKNNAPLQVIAGTLEVATGDIDATDIIHLAVVPWDAKVQKIILFNDDLDSGGTPTLATDIGLYSVTRDGTFTVVDIDAYASAVTTLQAANTVGVNLAFEARNIDKLGVNTVLTDSVATLTAVPSGQQAVISLTISNVGQTPAAGTISFLIEYVQ